MSYFNDCRAHNTRLHHMVKQSQEIANLRKEKERRNLGDPNQLIRCVGLNLKPKRNQAAYEAEKNGDSLISWQGDQGVKVDRYDCRVFLDKMPKSRASKTRTSSKDETLEMLGNYSRYCDIIYAKQKGISEADHIKMVKNSLTTKLVQKQQDDTFTDSFAYLEEGPDLLQSEQLSDVARNYGVEDFENVIVADRDEQTKQMKIEEFRRERIDQRMGPKKHKSRKHRRDHSRSSSSESNSEMPPPPGFGRRHREYKRRDRRRRNRSRSRNSKKKVSQEIMEDFFQELTPIEKFDECIGLVKSDTGKRSSATAERKRRRKANEKSERERKRVKKAKPPESNSSARGNLSMLDRMKLKIQLQLQNEIIQSKKSKIEKIQKNIHENDKERLVRQDKVSQKMRHRQKAEATLKRILPQIENNPAAIASTRPPPPTSVSVAPTKKRSRSPSRRRERVRVRERNRDHRERDRDRRRYYSRSRSRGRRREKERERVRRPSPKRRRRASRSRERRRQDSWRRRPLKKRSFTVSSPKPRRRSFSASTQEESSSSPARSDHMSTPEPPPPPPDDERF